MICWRCVNTCPWTLLRPWDKQAGQGAHHTNMSLEQKRKVKATTKKLVKDNIVRIETYWNCLFILFIVITLLFAIPLFSMTPNFNFFGAKPSFVIKTFSMNEQLLSCLATIEEHAILLPTDAT